MNASTVMKRDIGLGTARSTWKKRRRRREVRLPLQGLSETRRFARGELDVRVGNGAKVAVLAVGTYHLSLPSGLVLELNNCYCIPALSKNIISCSCLEEVDGYEIVIKNKCCSIYYKELLYGVCPLVNGLYVLELE